MKKILLPFFLLIISNTVYSQEEFRKHVTVILHKEPNNQEAVTNEKDKKNVESQESKKYQVYKILEKEENKKIKFDKSYKLSKSYEKTIKGYKYSFSKDSIIVKDSVKLKIIKKEEPDPVYSRLGKTYNKATVSVSKDSLLVNFWLQQNKEGKTYYDIMDDSTLNSDQKKELIKEFDYLPTEKYFIKLRNRESVPFYGGNWLLSAVTIPVKLHPSFTENNITTNSTVTTGVNANVFGGYKYGFTRYTYNKHTGMKQTTGGLTLGAFFGITSQAIDSTSTSIAKEPLDTEINVATLSYGIGLVGDIRKFEIGLFMGVDNALGSIGDKWNFDKRIWYGIGIGYKLNVFGKKEENE